MTEIMAIDKMLNPCPAELLLLYSDEKNISFFLIYIF